MTLTIKQRAFADDYIITGNATQSYLKVYKNVKSNETARANASRLLKTPKVQEYLEERMKELDKELIADQREILRALTRQARRQEKDYQVVVTKYPDYDDEGNFVLAEKAEIIETPTQNKDAIKAMELLGKRYGLWVEKVELETENKVVIVDDID